MTFCLLSRGTQETRPELLRAGYGEQSWVTLGLADPHAEVFCVPRSANQELKAKQKNNRKVRAKYKPCLILLLSCYKSVAESSSPLVIHETFMGIASR